MAMTEMRRGGVPPALKKRASLAARKSRAGKKKAAATATKASPVPSAESLLVDRVLSGESDLFYELVLPHQTMLFGMAMSMVKNESEAEDIVQETMVKAFTKLGTFRREAKFATWLVQIAINAARMRLRKNRRHVHESLEETAEPGSGNYSPKDLADWREIPSETLERSELRSALRRAIAALPRTSREVILLRDVRKLSTSETASILGTSVVAVKSRLLRARLQVRDALAPGIDGAWSLGETKWRRVRA